MASAHPVDVWIVDLDEVPAGLLEVLSKEERDRAAKLRDERGRARWAASRAALRAILGDRLRLDPRELAFELGPHGKPSLAMAAPSEIAVGNRAGDDLAGDDLAARDLAGDDLAARDLAGGDLAVRDLAGGDLATRGLAARDLSAGGLAGDLRQSRQEDLRFNLSHSGSIALYALASGREVGVDVERAHRRSPTDELALARRMLGSASEQRLSQLPAKERPAAFLSEWTAHEARAKCLGLGLGEARDPAVAHQLQRLWVCQLHPGEQAFAALALEGGPAQVRERVWGRS